MRLIRDTRGRPACWLFAAFCVSVICFWYPLIVIKLSHDAVFGRIATGVTLGFLPFGLIASFVAMYSYIRLWQRTRTCRGIVSRWLLSVGLLLFLIGAAPGLFLAFCLFMGFIACFRH